jgi:integrase
MREDSSKRRTVAPGIYRVGDNYYGGFTHPRTGNWTERKLAGARNKTEAKRARRDLLAKLAAGAVPPSTSLTLVALATAWLDTRRGRVRPRTLEADERNVDLIRKHFGTTTLARLDGRAIELFLAHLRNGKTTGRRQSEWSCVQAYKTLRQICDWAAANDALAYNPTTRVARHARPKQQSARKPRLLTPQQVDALVAAACAKTPAYAGVIALLAYTGCRAREGLAVRWGSIDTSAMLLAFTHQIDKAGVGLVDLKTDAAERANLIVPKLEPFLGRKARMQARWSADDDFVFSARRGKPREYRNLRRALATAAKEAGLGHVRPHDLRHSATSIMLQHGDLATVSRYVGHSNAAVTARVYAHAIGTAAEQAARVAAGMQAAGLGH